MTELVAEHGFSRSNCPSLVDSARFATLNPQRRFCNRLSVDFPNQSVFEKPGVLPLDESRAFPACVVKIGP